MTALGRSPTVVLAVGATIGVLMAAYGIARPSIEHRDVPKGAVAVVNGTAITTVDYQQALQALKSDRKRQSLEPGDRERVLERLVDEELLLQRALALDIPRQDGKIRASLTRAMIASIVGEVEEAPPSEAALEAHFEAHRDYFRQPTLLEVEQIFFSTAGDGGAPALGRAQAATGRLKAGESFEDVARDADSPPVALPRGLLPLGKLVDYLGPTAARTASELEGDGASGPVLSGDGYRLLRVTARSGSAPASFTDVREQVAVDYRRRADDRRLREYLEGLRAEAELRRPKEAP